MSHLPTSRTHGLAREFHGFSMILVFRSMSQLLHRLDVLSESQPGQISTLA